jgi:hypothetical protein
LTGTAQFAICWLLLCVETGNSPFYQIARIANRYVRGTVRLEGPPETRGVVKGSFPIAGSYGRFQYPNWACKFLIDDIRLKGTVSGGRKPAAALGASAASLSG